MIYICVSVEQPSSSSISTTTSSVTSMTSLEQEQEFSKGSVSDYDETWDTENWGDMDVSYFYCRFEACHFSKTMSVSYIQLN